MFFVFIIVVSCKSDDIQPSPTGGLEPKSSGEIVRHIYYTLSYSEDNEQAYGAYYQLTPELINETQSRTDDLRADPLISTGSATLADYSGSRYDRGHLCPAADMTLNKTSMSESFLLSNMSPQVPGFNRGKWSTLEDQVRKWALAFDGLDIATGPIFKDNLGSIGVDNVIVTGFFIKSYILKNGK